MSAFFREKEFFGLDIGSSSMRLVQLSASRGSYLLKAYGETKIPIGLSQSSNAMDLQQLSQIIKNLVQDARLSTKNVVAALPGSSTYTIVVKFPQQMSETEISQAVKWQAEKNIPLRIDEVNISWQLINPSVGSNREMAVMIVAAPKNKVEKLIKVLTGASLRPLSLEIAPVALSRAISQTGGQKIMILDIGATNTEIAVVQDGILYHSRTIPVASFAFTRALSQNLGLDINQAEQFKKRFGLLRDKLDGEIVKTLSPILSGMIEDVKRSIKFYQEQFGQSIDKILLSGGGANLIGLASYFSSILEVDVQTANPWEGINYSQSCQQDLMNAKAEYTTAVGLAKKGN